MLLEGSQDVLLLGDARLKYGEGPQRKWFLTLLASR